MQRVIYIWRDRMNNGAWQHRTTIVPDVEPLVRHYKNNGCLISILDIKELDEERST